MKFLLLVLALTTATYGHPGAGRQIVGGDEASYGEFPWMASLKANGQHFCGGTLINDEWVLTAGHCVDSEIVALGIEVTLGEFDLLRNEGREVRVKPANIIRHPDYADSFRIKNDIALIQLAEKITFTENIKPLALPPLNQEFTGEVMAAGWGASTMKGPANRYLQKTSFPIIDDDTCKNYYGMMVFDYSICVGHQEAGISVCPGDSGGPIMCEDQTYVCGVASWIYGGYECGAGEFPNVFTEVSHFVDWLEDTMNKQ